MTPLQQAAQELLELHLPTYLDTHVSQLRTALEAEQEKAVEPKCVARIEVFGKDWKLDYLSLPVGVHELYAQTYTYTHPAPPPAGEHVPEICFGNTERSALIARLRSTAYQDDEIKAHAREAADMLEADAASQARERHTRATLNKVLAGLNEAQQVAVPIAVSDAISRAGFMLVKTQSGYTLLPTGRIEAHHGIGAKPSHTDWSAA